MTTEPKPFALPPMPEPWAPQETSCFDDRKKWIDHSFQLAEIAQAQARRAERILEHAKAAHPHSAVLLVRLTQAEAERDALKARVAEMEASKDTYGSEALWTIIRAGGLKATLAQRDREVLALREGLDACVSELRAWMKDHGMDRKSEEAISKALASTAQAGAEAERRVRQDERERCAIAIWHKDQDRRWTKGEIRAFMEPEADILGTEPHP